MRLILILIFLAGTLSACANVSRFEKSALVAHGERLEGSQEPLYYKIWIDFKKPVDTRVKGPLLKFSSDSPPIAIGELKPALVARHLPPFIPPPQWPAAWKEKAKADDSYEGNGFHISFRDGQLQAVGICSHCAGDRSSPVVGTPDGEHYYPLPLTERQITDVFGSPDRIRKVNQVYY